MSPEVIKINNNTEIKTTRHQNGDIQSKPYVDGKTHGLETWRREGGTKQYKKMCNNGKTHGMEEWWVEDGSKWREAMWRSGKRHGVETEWWDSGQKQGEKMWMDGKEHGLQAGWYESGDKAWEIYRSFGEEYASIEWDENGGVTKPNFPHSDQQTPNPILTTEQNSKSKITSNLSKPTYV